ncbi:DUF6418 domain-containing protein [Rodentibacter ratti]|uniref:DUF6418 domain-containing protein n=1 Tax=Rodentibacter ratti TaxID=1906745 RepID=A0A1V3L8V3_9PAST|nr:DUF6418 domain-containing protein [Rodentibacter ratti]OOF86362.1 hypothetical protein BKG88_04610 [Rodentibacter ratti]
MPLTKLMKFILALTFIILSLLSLEKIFYINDFVLFGLFLLILFMELIVNTKRTFVNVLVVITIILNILGVFAIEYSTTTYYLYEIEQWISYEGSLPLLFLYQYSFLMGTFLIIKERAINELFIGPINYKKIFIFLLVSLLILTYGIILKHKPAPLLGVDRFAYDKDILGIWGQITNILFYFSLGLGVLFFKEKKKIYLYLLFLVLFAFLLKGHKFWNLVEILFLFFIPFSISIIRKKVLKLIFVISLGLAAFIIAAISINVYYFPSFEPIDYARQRLSQEGQLWWSTYKNYSDELRLDEISKEFNIYLNYNDLNQYDVGMYKVMQLNTTPERFEWKLAKLSRFTYSTPALIFYHFGSYIGIVMMFILGIISGLWLKLVFTSIMMGDLLLSIISSRFFYILRKGVKDGDIYKFFSLEFVILICIALGLYCFYKSKEDLAKLYRNSSF